MPDHLRFLRQYCGTRVQHLFAELRQERSFYLAFSFFSFFSLYLLWGFKYLPSIDLPLHFANVSIWSNFNDPSYGYQERFFFNGFTPYLIPYGVSSYLAKLIGVSASIRFLLLISCIAFAYGLKRLLHLFEGDPWWALFGFPMFFGFSFFMGFYSFLISLPIALFYLELSYRFTEKPSWKRAAFLSVFGIFLFFIHGITFAYCLAIHSIYFLLRDQDLRRTLMYLSTLSAVPIALLWRLFTPIAPVKNVDVPLLSLTWARIVHLFSAPLSNNFNQSAAGMFLTFLVIWLAASKPRLTKRWDKLLPLCVTMFGFIFVRGVLMGTFYVTERLNVFILIFFLLCLVLPNNDEVKRRSRVATVAISLIWFLFLTYRFSGFNLEAKSFDLVLAKIPKNVRFIQEHSTAKSEYVGRKPFFHFGGYVQAEKGGWLGNTLHGYFAYPFQPKSSTEDIYNGNFEDLKVYDYIVWRGDNAKKLYLMLKKFKARGHTYRRVPIPLAHDWLLLKRIDSSLH